MIRTLLRLAVLGSCAAGAFAQEHQHESPQQPPVHHHEAGAAMSSGPLDLPESRHASGTSWQPDSTPMHGVHFTRGSWAFMTHYNLFAGYDRQNGERGDSQWISTGWGMLMESRSWGGGVFVGRQMLSLEPLTTTKEGYPLLLQTGEAVDGEPLHDRQHPHDLFMEIAASYARPITGDLAFQVYVAPSGEPALGPAAFPHRSSAFSDPLAPLSHHWQDSTHIAFGVLTAGVFTRRIKVEGSWFNGREPDDERYDFDLRTPDSYSGRITVNPTESLSFQASYGYLKSPEELNPEESVHRLTASATCNHPTGTQGNWATTAVFGRNDPTQEPTTSAWLLETDLDLDGRNVLFGRAEYVEKTGHDLALPAALEAETFRVWSFSAGYLRQLPALGTMVPGIGLLATVNGVGSDLEDFYGPRYPTGFMVYLKIHPAAMSHASHAALPRAPRPPGFGAGLPGAELEAVRAD